MPTPSLNLRSPKTGERVRLVKYEVALNNGAHVVTTVRIPWTGPQPDHSCDADLCEFCIGVAKRKALAIAKKGGAHTTVKNVRLIRDGQAIAR